MEKQKIIDYLKNLNEFERISVDGQERKRLIFKNRDEIFEIFGKEEKEILSPFNDYTYEWLNSFLYNAIDFIEDNDFEDFDELKDNISEIIFEWIDSEVDIYTYDLTQWLANNNSNTYYLEEAIKENPSADNHLQLAQFKAIEELYYNALNILIDHLEGKFAGEEDD
jgi:hypothetical protein